MSFTATTPKPHYNKSSASFSHVQMLLCDSAQQWDKYSDVAQRRGLITKLGHSPACCSVVFVCIVEMSGPYKSHIHTMPACVHAEGFLQCNAFFPCTVSMHLGFCTPTTLKKQVVIKCQTISTNNVVQCLFSLHVERETSCYVSNNCCYVRTVISRTKVTNCCIITGYCEHVMREQ